MKNVSEKYTANQRKEQTGKVEKYINWLQRSERCHWQYGSTFIRLAVVAPKSVKSCEILRKFEPIAVQGHIIQSHQSWCQSKAHMQFPIRH